VFISDPNVPSEGEGFCCKMMSIRCWLFLWQSMRLNKLLLFLPISSIVWMLHIWCWLLLSAGCVLWSFLQFFLTLALCFTEPGYHIRISPWLLLDTCLRCWQDVWNYQRDFHRTSFVGYFTKAWSRGLSAQVISSTVYLTPELKIVPWTLQRLQNPNRQSPQLKL
jgi:hypothetical protein